MKTFFFLLSLSLISTAFAQEMRFGNIGPFNIAGDEYWEFIDGNPHPQATVNGVPKAGIIWNFDEAREATQQCALRGNEQLVNWLEDPESRVYKALLAFKEAGGNARFFAWTNNFMGGNNWYQNGMRAGQRIRDRRRPRAWYWKNSLIKYESTIAPNGTCTIPRENQVVWKLGKETEKLLLAQASNNSGPTSNGQQEETPPAALAPLNTGNVSGTLTGGSLPGGSANIQ